MCKEVTEQLTSAADSVVSLYKRINETSSSNLGDGDNSHHQNLQQILEMSIKKNVSILQDVLTLRQNGVDVSTQNQNGVGAASDAPLPETIQKLSDLASGDFPNDESNVINFMHKYSDILLNIMQQKMSNINK